MESRNAEWGEDRGDRVGSHQSRLDRPLEGKVARILRLNRLNASSIALDLLLTAVGIKKG